MNIMFPPTRCAVFISGHGADRRRGRGAGGEVTLTAVAAVLVFLGVPLALTPPFLGCETKASRTTPLEVVMGIRNASSGRPWLLGSGGWEWGAGGIVKVGASAFLPAFPDVPQPSAFKAALPPLMAANETIFHLELPYHKARQAAF